MMNVQLTMKSGNKKTGPIPVSTSSNETCPSVCPLKDKGCYARFHYLGKNWSLISQGVRGNPWPMFLAQVAAFKHNTLWRHNAAGDLPGKNNVIDTIMLNDLVKANKGKRGFTYTHKETTNENLNAIEQANNNGFTINLSANNLQHADELANKSTAPIVTILPSYQLTNTVTPEGRKVVVCPAISSDKVNCSTCKLCAMPDRKVIIGFPAHGASDKTVSTIAEGPVILAA